MATYIVNVKPVQILMDEELLAGLDEDEEVLRSGRSKVMRGLVRPISKASVRCSWTRSTERATATTSG